MYVGSDIMLTCMLSNKRWQNQSVGLGEGIRFRSYFEILVCPNYKPIPYCLMLLSCSILPQRYEQGLPASLQLLTGVATNWWKALPDGCSTLVCLAGSNSEICISLLCIA